MILVKDRMAIGSWATNELLNSGGAGAIFLDSTPNFFFKDRFHILADVSRSLVDSTFTKIPRPIVIK